MENGYIIGRFNHITNGHKRLIEIGLKVTDKLVLLVGSADKFGTERNPFPISDRIMLIEKVFEKEVKSGKLIIVPIDDMTNENDIPANGAWGRCVIQAATNALGVKPNISIYGYEDSRTKWYLEEDIKDIEELVYMRGENSISATKIRNMLKNNKKEEWLKNTPCQIHSFYDKLKKIIDNI